MVAPTVFMIDGYGAKGGLPLTKIVQQLGGNRVQVPYNNQVGNNVPVIVECMETLDKYLNDPKYNGPKVVVAISQGCRAANIWQRKKGPTSPVHDLSFLNLADPENPFTGSVVITPKLYPGDYGGVGIPGGTRFPTEVFSRQYDGVCDYPNRPNPNWLTVLHAQYGMVRVHNNYLFVSLSDAGNRSVQKGNIKYTWSPTAPSMLFGGNMSRGLFERDYDRPVKLG